MDFDYWFSFAHLDSRVWIDVTNMEYITYCDNVKSTLEKVQQWLLGLFLYEYVCVVLRACLGCDCFILFCVLFPILFWFV